MNLLKYQPSLRLVTGQRRALLSALISSTHQLKLYVRPEDKATVVMIKEHNDLIAIAEATLSYERRHHLTARRKRFFQPVGKRKRIGD